MEIGGHFVTDASGGMALLRAAFEVGVDVGKRYRDRERS